jgi:hypothetical protein
MIREDTIKLRAGMLRELNNTIQMTREQIGQALNIPTDEGLLHEHLLAMLEQKLIDRKGTSGAKGNPGTKGNPYQYFILPDGVPILRFLGLI